MSDNTEKAEEKLLASISNSQDESKESVTPKRTAVSRKRTNTSVKNTQSGDETVASSTGNYEMRSHFVGRLRWPD